MNPEARKPIEGQKERRPGFVGRIKEKVRKMMAQENLDLSQEGSFALQEIGADFLTQAAVQKSKLEVTTPDRIFENIKNPHYIPSLEELHTVFKDNSAFDWNEVVRNEDGDVTSYEVWNREYITQLSFYLQERISERGVTDRPLKIYEVGAGNGRLSHFLRMAANEHGYDDAVEIIACDTFDRKIAPDFPVKEMAFEEALADKPDIVISSWTPLGADWKDKALEAGVDEFIAIGELGMCGMTEENLNYWEEVPSEQYEIKSLENLQPLQVNLMSDFREFKGGEETSTSVTRSYRKKI